VCDVSVTMPPPSASPVGAQSDCGLFEGAPSAWSKVRLDRKRQMVFFFFQAFLPLRNKSSISGGRLGCQKGLAVAGPPHDVDFFPFVPRWYSEEREYRLFRAVFSGEKVVHREQCVLSPTPE